MWTWCREAASDTQRHSLDQFGQLSLERLGPSSGRPPGEGQGSRGAERSPQRQPDRPGKPAHDERPDQTGD